MDPALDRRERLLGVERIRRADVEDIGPLGVEPPAQVVVTTPDAHHLHADLRERPRVHAPDEPAPDDRRPHRDARNIRVRTSMSSRACSGGVRHSTPSTTHAWKWRSSRAKLSS